MIHEIEADLLTYQHDDLTVPIWKVLPTNYTVTNSGLAIMGAGLAKQYTNIHRTAEYELGALIQCNPTVLRVLPLGIHGNAFWWALPTKREPSENSSVDILRNGLWELALYYQRQVLRPVIVVPRLGCGCGKMKWRYAKPIIESELTKVEEVIICHMTKFTP
jgi:hypothetical protein